MNSKTPNRGSGSNFQFLYSNNESSNKNAQSILSSPYNINNTSGTKQQTDFSNNSSSLISLKSKQVSNSIIRTENPSPVHFSTKGQSQTPNSTNNMFFKHFQSQILDTAEKQSTTKSSSSSSNAAIDQQSSPSPYPNNGKGYRIISNGKNLKNQNNLNISTQNKDFMLSQQTLQTQQSLASPAQNKINQYKFQQLQKQNGQKSPIGNQSSANSTKINFNQPIVSSINCIPDGTSDNGMNMKTETSSNVKIGGSSYNVSGQRFSTIVDDDEQIKKSDSIFQYGKNSRHKSTDFDIETRASKGKKSQQEDPDEEMRKYDQQELSQNFNSSADISYKDGEKIRVKFNTVTKKISDLVKYLQYRIQQFQREKQHDKAASFIRQYNQIIGFQSSNGNLTLTYLFTLPHHTLDIFDQKNLNIEPIYRQELTNIDTNQVCLKDFNFLKCVGIGGFSRVYLVQQKDNGKMYALKLIDKGFIIQNRKEGIVQNERDIMTIVDHPFLLQCEYSFESQQYIAFATEYCSGGELFYHLRRVKRMTQDQARFYMAEICLGIQFLHDRGIIYRDLKPENIFMDIDGHIRIGDYGLAKPDMADDELAHSFCGSPQYMAPEMLLKVGHNYPIDYYCLGALLYELVIGLPPFYSQVTDEIYDRILKEDVTFPSRVSLSSDIKGLLVSLLTQQPKQRLGSKGGIPEIMNHVWFQKIDFHQLLQKKIPPPIKPDTLNFNFDEKEFNNGEGEFRNRLNFNLLQNDSFKPIFQNFYFDSNNNATKNFTPKINNNTSHKIPSRVVQLSNHTKSTSVSLINSLKAQPASNMNNYVSNNTSTANSNQATNSSSPYTPMNNQNLQNTMSGNLYNSVPKNGNNNIQLASPSAYGNSGVRLPSGKGYGSSNILQKIGGEYPGSTKNSNSQPISFNTYNNNNSNISNEAPSLSSSGLFQNQQNPLKTSNQLSSAPKQNQTLTSIPNNGALFNQNITNINTPVSPTNSSPVAQSTLRAQKNLSNALSPSTLYGSTLYNSKEARNSNPYILQTDPENQENPYLFNGGGGGAGGNGNGHHLGSTNQISSKNGNGHQISHNLSSSNVLNSNGNSSVTNINNNNASYANGGNDGYSSKSPNPKSNGLLIKSNSYNNNFSSLQSPSSTSNNGSSNLIQGGNQIIFSSNSQIGNQNNHHT